jgi:hypothetical protein
VAIRSHLLSSYSDAEHRRILENLVSGQYTREFPQSSTTVLWETTPTPAAQASDYPFKIRAYHFSSEAMPLAQAPPFCREGGNCLRAASAAGRSGNTPQRSGNQGLPFRCVSTVNAFSAIP